MAGENWTDDQAIDAWLEYMEAARGRSERTIAAYRLALERLKEFLHQDGRSVIDARADELEVFCGLWLHKKGVVARSRKPYISAVKGFFAWLRGRGIVRHNAGAELLHPVTGKPLPRVISLANAERLMWAPDLSTFIGIRDGAILSLLIGCGLRVSGLTGMNESHLKTIEIDGKPRMVIRVTEKGKKERLMPVPKEAEVMLRVYLGHEDLASIDRDIVDTRGQPDRVLFVSLGGRRLGTAEHRGENRRLTRKAVYELIQRYGKRLDIPADELHPHALRHLFGTELTEEDVPTVAVAELMGHSDIKSTAVYVHMAMRRKAGLLDKHGPLGRMKTPLSDLLRRLPG
jgi:site-specific recombinase XerD